MQQVTSRPRMRAETFNMLFAAIFLVVVAVVAFAVNGIVTYRRAHPASTSVSTAPRTITVTVGDPRRGAFSFYGDSIHADVSAQSVIPLAAPWDNGNIPYLTASAALQAMPDTVMALRALCADIRVLSPSVTPVITDACRTCNDGITVPSGILQSGYAVTLALRHNDTGEVSPLTATEDSAVASVRSWLVANRTRYGFVPATAENAAGTAEVLLYVGAAHAAAMEAAAPKAEDGTSPPGVEAVLSPAAYLTLLRSHPVDSPLCVTRNGVSWQVFYVPARSDNTAEFTLPSDCAYTVTGDGTGGFLVAAAVP